MSVKSQVLFLEEILANGYAIDAVFDTVRSLFPRPLHGKHALEGTQQWFANRRKVWHSCSPTRRSNATACSTRARTLKMPHGGRRSRTSRKAPQRRSRTVAEIPAPRPGELRRLPRATSSFR